MIEKVFFATGNKNKVREVQSILAPIVVEQADIDIPEIQGSPKDIIINKVKKAYEMVGQPVIVDDGGFNVEGWGGMPGPYIKYFIDAMKPENLAKAVLDSCDGRASFLLYVAYYAGKGRPLVAKGEVKGQIVLATGESGFGIDPIFRPDGYDMTYAQMDPELKNSFSHRRQAFDVLKEKMMKLK